MRLRVSDIFFFFNNDIVCETQRYTVYIFFSYFKEIWTICIYIASFDIPLGGYDV